MKQTRIRDFGISIGSLPAGPRNKITDVAGVTVGHCTVMEGSHQTGVTVILPCPENPFSHKLPAASFVLNGFGKTQGLIQMEELGSLETPIALTNTLNIGLVHDALVEYMLQLCRRDHIPLFSVNPIVCECNDSSLNQIGDRVLTKDHVFSAIRSAAADFEEGSVGAGRGTVCYGFKGGIGSSSRQFELDGVTYTLGVLVQSNHGRGIHLTIDGKKAGAEILKHNPQAAFQSPTDRGSIILIIATDLPVSDRQLRRIIKRAGVGLIRTGSYLGNGSGDIMLGFSTAYTLADTQAPAIQMIPILNESNIEQAFLACAEAAEEAILNSLVTAETVTGVDGHTRHSLSEWLPTIL